MTGQIKRRILLLSIAIALMGALIVAVTVILQIRAVQARALLSRMDLESFRIADYFRERLRSANDKMRLYGTTDNPQDWQAFLSATRDLKSWLATQSPQLPTPKEQEILKQMDGAFGEYLKKARELHELMAQDGKPGASVSQFESFLLQARRFMDLGEALGRAHLDSRNLALANSSRTLTELRYSLLLLVALLFAFGAALAARVYSDLIAPLRVKLVETQALAERNEKLASLGLLAAGVAHEIRNPLTAIKTALFTQQKKFVPGSPGHMDGEVIDREISRLERIVNQFLQFARPAQPELSTISVSQPLEQVEALLAPQLAEKEIKLIRENSSVGQIRVDPSQIQQVLINLIQNAADSIGKKGTITLRARSARLRLPSGETDVAIMEVADTGKGIPQDVEHRLFDPFFTTKESGTGLGLSIAARIVEMHGGALQYQTQVEHGSTFGIVLPRVS